MSDEVVAALRRSVRKAIGDARSARDEVEAMKVDVGELKQARAADVADRAKAGKP